MRVTYEPGGMLAIVADDGVAVLPAGLPQERIDDVWEGLDSGDGVEAVLQALSQASGPAASAMPPFAIALLQGEAVRTAVRGDLQVTIETLAGEETLIDDGTSGAWTMRLVDDALAVRVRPGTSRPAAASELPIASGAVLAAGVYAVFFEPELVDPEFFAPELFEPEPDTDAMGPVGASRSGGDDAPDAPVPDDVVRAAPEETLMPPAGDEQDALAPRETPVSPETPVTQETPVSEETPVPQETLDPPSVSGPLAPLLLEPLTDGRDAPPLGDHDGETITAEQFALLRAQVAETQAAEAQAAEARAAGPAAEGDHDGATITFAEAQRLRSESQAGPRRTSGETAEVPLDEVPFPVEEGMSATAAPVGAPPVARLDPPVPPPPPPAPPSSPFAPGATSTRSRGRIRLSTGESVELDRPVIVGRRPRSSRTTGADMPRLVAVESPQNDISRNHVEIASDGETVVVTDLHTTNGTVLRRAGRAGASAEPVRLHPGEQTVVVSGDIVDIGDGVTIAFEELP
ncbi:FHA domain-containing protein [Microbacterium sp. NPDC096154]|uniref:FHA domain-containing protein n=1 Tax=Microbacterium sp. NPDC096154 TaxID=3155549 RepID=UPI00331DAA3F